jgi:hypothetical protein
MSPFSKNFRVFQYLSNMLFLISFYHSTFNDFLSFLFLW